MHPGADQHDKKKHAQRNLGVQDASLTPDDRISSVQRLNFTRLGEAIH